jgi:hypothetical protein
VAVGKITESTKNLEKILIAVLYHSDEGSGKNFAISTGNFTDNSSYDIPKNCYPIIKNDPTIRQSLDLEKSTSKTGDITISCHQNYTPNNKLSELLLYGDNDYLNRRCDLYIAFQKDLADGDLSPGNLNHLIQLYVGRLVDVSATSDFCELKIQTKRPWDHLSIPNNFTVSGTLGESVPVPVSYGDFDHGYSGSLPTYSNKNVADEDLYIGLKPCPRFSTNNLYHWYAVGEVKESGKGALFLFDKSINAYIPLTDQNTQTSASATGENGTYYYSIAKKNLKRGFGYYPSSVVNTGSMPNTFYNKCNLGNIISTNLPLATKEWYCEFRFPFPSGTISTSNVAKIEFQTDIRASNIVMPSGGAIVMKWQYAVNSDTSWTDAHTMTITSASPSSQSDLNNIKTVSLSSGEYAENISLKFSVSYSGSGGSVYLYSGATKTDVDYVKAIGEFESSSDSVEEVLYSYQDGFLDSWNGSPALCTNVIEAHRDILYRYCGVTDNPIDWATSLSDRSDWKVRYCISEPEDVKDVLERLQYEGCFIFTYSRTLVSKYIVLKSDYSSVSQDWDFTDNDISKLNISHTRFSKMETEYRIRYAKYQELNNYRRYTEYKSGGSDAIRDKYNIETKENIKEVSLDAVYKTETGADIGVEDFANYYFNILGDMKILVSGTLVNPKFYTIDIGDIVCIDSSALKPFNKDWNDANSDGTANDKIKFIITELQISVREIKFKAREV